MRQLRINLLANYAGKALSVVMGLMFVPIYIRFIGIEAYGLVGFYLTIQTILSVMDFGLSTTLNRELAQRSMSDSQSAAPHDLVRTLEVTYWLVALLMGLAVAALSPTIAHHWIQTRQMAPDDVQHSVTIMGAVLAFQWPLKFYIGGIMGLQRQVLANTLNGAAITLRNAGAAFILWQVSPTVQAFLYWQVAANAIQTGLAGFLLWHCLPKANHWPQFSPRTLLTVWRFAAGMSTISIASLLLTQMDKLILSRMLSMEHFGYYSLASTVAGSLYVLTAPFFDALFPTFSRLAALENTESLKRLYHASSQLVSVILLPATVVLALFSSEILLLWTGAPSIADNASQVVTILAIGTAFNGLMSLPYALQLASGWTRLSAYSNAVAAAVLVPFMVVMTLRYGTIGAALVWPILNIGYVLITLQIMHRRILSGELRQWYHHDVGLPALACSISAIVLRWLLGTPTSMIGIAIIVAVTYLIALLCAAAVTPVTANWMRVAMRNNLRRGMLWRTIRH